MNHVSEQLAIYGPWIVMGWVFLEQIGLPIPAAPVLFLAGTLVSGGKLNPVLLLIASLSACVAADWIWYEIGRLRGAPILNVFCRISWEPDSCIQKTKGVFSRYGEKAIVFSKFIPGLATITPPLAGVIIMNRRRFLLLDSIGSLLWSAIPIFSGMYLQSFMARWSAPYEILKQYLPWLIVMAIIGFLAWRYWERTQYLKDNSMDEIAPADLLQKIESNHPVRILDVRSDVDLLNLPHKVIRSERIPFDDLETRMDALSQDIDIAVYCDCPKDEGAKAAVILLKKNGFAKAKPLAGGIRAWIQQGLPTESTSMAS